MLAACVGAVVLLSVRVLAGRAPASERSDVVVRRWLLRSAVLLGGGLLVSGVASVLLPGTPVGGAGLAAGTFASAAAAYQGLVRWNRQGTPTSDPGDWLNGAGAVLAAAALAYLVVGAVPGFDDVPAVPLAMSLARAAALLVLLGTVGTVLAIADLRSSRRALALTAGTGAALGGAVADVVALPGAVVPGTGLAGVITSGAFGAVLAWIAVSSSTSRAPRDASPHATTWGSVVVIVAGTGIVLASSWAGRPPGAAVGLAGAAVLVGAFRVGRLVRDLESLIVSREEARTDALTGARNRRALVEALAGSPAGRGAALLVVDLDRFKEVNDQHGHAVGDRVVRVAADRLRGVAAGHGLVARLGGDEFAVLLDDADPGRARAFARRACRVIEDPIEVDGLVLRLAASIGVASTALGTARGGELLRCADVAMFAAKRAGLGVSVYDQPTDAALRDRRALVGDLRAMLERGESGVGEVVLHFQPQLDARTGAPVAVEALVRWDHPRRGLLHPDSFLDVVEEIGLMNALTWHVLDAATHQAARWRASGHDLPVAVNLSATCLELPGLVDVLRGALRRSGLPASHLVVEVTETTLMRDAGRAVDVAGRIQALGVDVSIDDFGTGYSSLTYLKDLPARELKLDRSFTRSLAHEPRTRAIVSGTVDLAHRLGLRVVAEGVEDDATLRVLRELDCDRTQGYLHSRPVPAADLGPWLERARPRAVSEGRA